jgi:hypothetical protein
MGMAMDGLRLDYDEPFALITRPIAGADSGFSTFYVDRGSTAAYNGLYPTLALALGEAHRIAPGMPILIR